MSRKVDDKPNDKNCNSPCGMLNAAGFLSCRICGWSEDDDWFKEK